MHLSVFEACQIEIRYKQCLRIHNPLVTFPEILERITVMVPTESLSSTDIPHITTSKWIV